MSIPATGSRTGGAVGTGNARVVVRFLGSMNLAIILLLAVGLASIIGTVLQQNQPHPDYLVQFGPFWFGIFRSLGLYDVYSAGWFLFLVAFLVTSTTVCLYRHTPTILREMSHFGALHQARSLRALDHHREWTASGSVAEMSATVQPILLRAGYRVRPKRRGEAVLLAGLAGRGNRLGYVFTHLAVVVICAGGVLDSNLNLKLRAWTGHLVPETRNVPLSETVARSRLPGGPGAFRGSVTIPEEGRANAVLLPLGEGYVVRQLPFEIRVEAFRILRYADGQPRSYESDLLIRDANGERPVRHTIRVNEPLRHNGYTIYQSSFSDGGSRLDITAWPLAGDGFAPEHMHTAVFQRREVVTDNTRYQLEFTHFERHNVRRDGSHVGNQPMSRDIGPSFRYVVRGPDGSMLEYENTARPIELDGGRYLLSGIRSPGSEEFRYLHVPVDQHDSPARFAALVALLRGEALMDAGERAVRRVMADLQLEHPALRAQLQASVPILIRELRRGGLPAVEQLLEGSGSAADTLTHVPRELLRETLEDVYRRALAASGDDPDRPLAEEDYAFLQHTVTSIPALRSYGAPVFLQLRDFDQRQATGLEITRRPGQPIVYAGFLLLVAGLVLMFYVHYRRAWCWIEPLGTGSSRVLLAGQPRRFHAGYRQHFERLAAAVAGVCSGNR